MGIIRKPQIRDYWEISNTYSTPVFGLNMSRDRFLYLKKCIIYYNYDEFKRIKFFEV